MTVTGTRSEPIAIVGSACRFAGGASSPSKLWDVLRDPKDHLCKVPESRFNVDGVYHPNPSHHGHSNARYAYLLDQDPTVFDAEFFGINGMESKAMDPQQRFALEIVYESLQDAGFTVDSLRGSDTAVFVGVMSNDHEIHLMKDIDMAPTYFAVGNARSILSNRISYFFDWHGASITVDTACSSSLVAVHQAVQTLRDGSSSVAIACGANLILGPEMFIVDSKLKMLSPNGRSRMWDKDANGYARGEGVAALVLKPLSAALEAGDTIQCLIRETGVNQDGATAGLTMPSAAAQCALIKSTYARAGLDLQSPQDRPQYFEAHGTGTPAGDPVESEAIQNSFFPRGHAEEGNESQHPLYVGSIKTVIGHTEGTAGIAGILKAVLAIKNSTIPPNLLFENLSPAVAPFYRNVEILRKAKPWPTTSRSQTKRVSVNSFGFGGTNAHAILESFEQHVQGSTKGSFLFTPFVFSAASEQSLRAYLEAYDAYLDQTSGVNAHDLAYTLRSRRTILPYRISFHASSAADLGASIKASLAETDRTLAIRTTSRSGQASGIIGIFTGQGAQYARMGAELIQNSPLARSILMRLEANLKDLPSEDRPTWSLTEELLKDASSSRLNGAAVSQPLCTAIQIMLVDLLAEAGICFSSVVGHSSGEIAAAYAAGFLSARDSICVAYLRGLQCDKARSPNRDIQGAMLAVGTSMEDAVEICSEDEFIGRICVAASNSSSSVTISGDEDAIEELKTILNDEKKFNRRLKVDKAYHSNHMYPCVQPYLDSLRAAGINAQIPSPSRHCKWISSVYQGKTVDSSFSLSDSYWTDNLTKPVLFSQALSTVLSSGIQSNLALEIGPHPALQGPATQVIQDVLGKTLPYHGTLYRNKDSIESLSNSLGSLWSHSPKGSIDLERYQAALTDHPTKFTVVQDLPSYQWDHNAKIWYETRVSRASRSKKTPFHPLLGHASPDSAPYHLRWKNVLVPVEMPWLAGHQVQQQIVYPASGYISTALEAARCLVEDEKKICLIEVENFAIHQAILFESDTSQVEILVELSQISRLRLSEISAKLSYSASVGAQGAEFTLVADGTVKVYLDDRSLSLLSSKSQTPPYLVQVESQRLYDSMEVLGYNFLDSFRSLTSIKRKSGFARCVASIASSDTMESVLVHPVDLDAAFQSVLMAYSYPGDGKLRNLHLPASITRLRVNPASFPLSTATSTSFDLDSTYSISDKEPTVSGFEGSATIYRADSSHAAIEVDNVHFEPVGAMSNADRQIFHGMDWVYSEPNGTVAAIEIPIQEGDMDLVYTFSRAACYFLRQFDEQVPEDSPARLESPNCHYLRYARHVTNLVRTGQHRYVKGEWANDSLEDVKKALSERWVSDNPFSQIIFLVGENMPAVFRGEHTILEHFRSSGLLDHYYSTGFGTEQCTIWLADMARQITVRHPHAKILEVGAGTGGATKRILQAIGSHFGQYTFTDISPSFFENAADIFSAYQNQMVFKTYDAEKDPTLQGFAEGSQDVIVCSLVVHATANLERTLRYLRKLLRPGGYLLMAEGNSYGPLAVGAGFIFGTLSGWWLGVDEGRTLTPFIDEPEWESLLQRAGFSGIDTGASAEIAKTYGLVLSVSQAVDDRIRFLREPFSAPNRAGTKTLVIVGGESDPVKSLANRLDAIFSHDTTTKVHRFTTLQDVDDSLFHSQTKFICLTELETPFFKNVTQKNWPRFRKFFDGDHTVMWVTSNREEEPFSNVLVGLGRTAMRENPNLRLQFLDIIDADTVDPQAIANVFSRFCSQYRDDGDLFYRIESEIKLDVNGHELVPRYQPLAVANNRYNSFHRPVRQELDLDQATVEIYTNSYGYEARHVSRFDNLAPVQDTSTFQLHVTHSIAEAIRTPLGFRFVVLGLDESQDMYLALASTVRSSIQVSRDSCVPCNKFKSSPALQLVSVASPLLSMTILDDFVSHQKVVFHNAPVLLAFVAQAYAKAKTIDLVFTTNAVDLPPSVESSISWVHLPRFQRQSELRKLIPQEVDGYFDFTQNGSTENLAMLLNLPNNARVESAKNLFSSKAISCSTSDPKKMQNLLLRAMEHTIHSHGEGNVLGFQKVDPKELTGNQEHISPMAVVDWTTTTSLPVRVCRLDHQSMFKNDKTYWLCGMSGDLGISIMDWMIAKGARYLVLTSRNPKVDGSWLEQHRGNGVHVELLACDVTDEQALRRTHQRIVNTLPPIVGALNGAMVLKDATISNMQFEQIRDVIQPKILGSLHLDKIFHETNLDFFILMSSVNCVIGNQGQANYAAANMGVCAISAARRKRGLNSSCINLGTIYGVGYITQSARQLDQALKAQALMPLSGDDVHQIIAESIEAGYLGSSSPAELTTGLDKISSSAAFLPTWISDPKFAHYIRHQDTEAEETRENIVSVSLQDRLNQCHTKEDVHKLVRSALSEQLRKRLLQSTPDDDLLTMDSMALGIDSLIAVDIRSWLIKTLEVNIPVLQIMSNDMQMGALAEMVAERIPGPLTPALLS
ncbi:hypothetical protein ACHAPJ_008297 [Fusarium lateritium]